MDCQPKVYEEQLQDIWKNQSFSRGLKTISELDVVILDPGFHNEDEAGPDFKNARIRIGNLVYVGDIEIDREYQHWKEHGHNIDRKYNKVILHVCLHNKNSQSYVYTKDGRKVPTLALSRFVDIDFPIVTESRNHIEKKDHPNKEGSFVRCASESGYVDYEIKKKFLTELGIDRFKKKCERVYLRLKELTFIQHKGIKEPVIVYDLYPDFDNFEFSYKDFSDKKIWRQLFYEMVFEALGYSKNKTIMLRLAQSVDIDFLSKLGSDGEFVEIVESALFNIGGLVPDVARLPEESSDYTKKLISDWQLLRRIYDGDTFSETDWHFFKIRPSNFPTLRLAGGVRFIKKLLYKEFIEKMLSKIEGIEKPNVLVNALRNMFVIQADGYWSKHFVFDAKTENEINYFVGAARADEIVVNVVLPFAAVYYEVFGREDLIKKVLRVYSCFKQNSDNRIVREVAQGLKIEELLKKTIYSQGMLELFRSYCSKQRCLECKIGQEIFE